MALAPALRAAVAVLRARAADLLPAYFLGPAVPAVARVVTLAGAVITGLYLETTGRLARVRAAAGERQLDPPDPSADPEAFGRWVETVVPLFDPLVTPTTIALLAATAVASILAYVLCSAVVTAAQFSACLATLRDRRGTTAAVAGAGRYWLVMLSLFVLEVGAWLVVLGAAVAVVAGAAAVSPIAAALVGLLVGLVVLTTLAAVRLVFAFAPVAVVVEDADTRGGLSHALDFVRSESLDAVGYSVLAVASLSALGSVAGVSAEAGGSVVGVVTFLLLSPVLGLTKTALYAGHVDSISPPDGPAQAVTSQFTGGLGRGLHETAGFVRERPGLNLLSALLFAGGLALGWLLAAPLDGVVTASIEARLDGHVPPTAALFFGTNNWTVAVGSAYSGLGLGLPAVVSLAFNGAAFGVLGRLEVAPLELLAFVVPHGLLEIPALIVAGALGLSLGATAWRARAGRTSPGELEDAIERAFWVLVGVGVVLAVAGLVEGFVSPYYYRPFLASVSPI